MEPLLEAAERRCPEDPVWVRQAVASITQVRVDTPVRDVAQGWLITDPGQPEPTREVLFVLTEDRLGIGRASAPSAGWPTSIGLDSIVAVDAIEGLPWELMAVELTTSDGVVLLAGWPEPFVDSLLAALGEILDAHDAHDAHPAASPEPESTPAPADALPAALADPAEAAAHVHPSGLDGLDEPLVEPEVTPAWDPSPADLLDADVTIEADPQVTVDADPGVMADDPMHQFLAEEDGHAAPPFDEAAAPGGPAPWESPSMTWPEDFTCANYLGGHPDHPRRRKNLTLAFAPAGIAVRATGGIGKWGMVTPWERVSGIEIQGSDELRFTHGHRIDMNSSAIVVDLVDGTSMVFEIRQRRPATVRATLAPVIHMANGAAAFDPYA